MSQNKHKQLRSMGPVRAMIDKLGLDELFSHGDGETIADMSKPAPRVSAEIIKEAHVLGIRPCLMPSLRNGDTIVLRDGSTYRGRPPTYTFVPSADGISPGTFIKVAKGLPYVRVRDRKLQSGSPKRAALA